MSVAIVVGVLREKDNAYKYDYKIVYRIFNEFS